MIGLITGELRNKIILFLCQFFNKLHIAVAIRKDKIHYVLNDVRYVS
jgi:hypothetical protein